MSSDVHGFAMTSLIEEMPFCYINACDILLRKRS